MKKNILLACIITLFSLMLVSCNESDMVNMVSPTASAKPKPTKPTKTEEPTQSPEPTEDLSNKAINPFTGLYIDKVIANRRPVAVVINNLHKAKPQSGIGQADIIYEVLAEGDITRLIAIFKDFNSEKIGPVRSTRHYFLDFALDNNAIFVHHGGSPQGYNELRRLGINNLDGMREANTFWRDSERIKKAGMYEHSSYTSAENILRDSEAKGYKMENSNTLSPFMFYNEQTQPKDGISADEITIPFSDAYTTVFKYDKEKSTYLKFQGEDKHIDEETGEQLEVSNVIIQNVDMHVISGDDAGRREVKLIGSGEGYIATGGKYTPIKWEKASEQSPTMWYDEFGYKLQLNKGKTWICVYDGDAVFKNTELEKAIQEDLEEKNTSEKAN